MYKGDLSKHQPVGEGVLGCFQRHTHRVNQAPHCCTEILNSRFTLIRAYTGVDFFKPVESLKRHQHPPLLHRQTENFRRVSF